MNRKIIPIAALLLAILTTFSACSAPQRADSSSAGGGNSAAAPEAPRNADFADEDGGYDKELINDSAFELGKANEIANQTEAERKIIWNASMDIEAQDAAALHADLSARAAALGGYEYGNDIQHYENYSVVRATFKVPPEKIQEFMAYAGEAGKLVNSSLGSEDITEGYYDSEIRLDTKRKSLERYYELLAEAADAEGIVYIQRIIDGITEEIETLEGRLRMWDVLSDMATVSVTLRQQNDPIKLQREINWKTLTAADMAYLVKGGLVAVCSGALTVLQWLAVALAVTSPLWIIALAVLGIALRRRKKRRALQAQEPADETPEA